MADKYYVVVQDADRPVVRETIVFLNTRGGKNPDTGEYIPPACKGMEPDGIGIYAIFDGDEYYKEKNMAMERALKDLSGRILGPFESRDEAIQAEMRARPMSAAQKLAVVSTERDRLLADKAKSDAENKTLRADLAAMRRSLEDVTKKR